MAQVCSCRMPYIPRILDPDGYYHVICRGNNKAVIFQDANDYKKYKEFLAVYKNKTPFSLYHYALMPNHVHLIVRAERGQSLSEIMKRINHSYSLYHKRRYDFVGHLWQGRFKSKLIDTEAYMLTCGIYIALNPVRANIVEHAPDYPWSSAGAYLELAADQLIEPDPEYLALGNTPPERIAAYRALLTMWKEVPRLPKKSSAYF